MVLLTLISISLTAGCDLFIRYVARTSALEYEDFNSAKSRLLERAEKFGEISCRLLLDSAVAYSMDEVDMVFVGADGVVESGGVINMMGTYQIALVAHSMNKPVYVAAESYKDGKLFLNF
ncbi:NagB/RpiA/CoA transferase-like superfamily protein [Raphanus sativus]|nr:NagB/RpiA/CoA transferase-like superfamily protein [Raphanus sativus]